VSPGPGDGPYRIEPLDPDRHDRAAFSCGVAQVDNYFKKTANKLARANNTRVYVLSAPSGDVIGFYAINAHAVAYADLPASYARNRPAHGLIPAAFIAMIGRDERYRGGGFGGLLLADALKRIARAADELGIAVVLLDVLDCGRPERVAQRKALYAAFGFQPLAAQPLRMVLPIHVVRTLLADTESAPAAR